ncbi:hypothetical protein H4R20_003888 [Coemansia guatemalensis]|uniref:Uncharacterized protein n=1 Tax=Coemansia guatemalensis TaxID=2761395 RepID=A0A9W8LSK8_9FUNG|nr:hypothetical protein H4R20_003888 [Coemansia guatemalensis]
MHVAGALFAVFGLVASQEVGFSGGANVVDGPNAISNPNVNNGWQADSSLFAGSGSNSNGGSSVFNDVFGSSFTNINSNTAIKDNIVNNPSVDFVSGNSGWTANGDRNQLGPVQNDFAHRRRDVVFASNHHQAQSQVAETVAAPVPHIARPLSVGPVFPADVAKRGGDVVFADHHHQTQSQVASTVAAPVPQIARPLPIGAGPAFIKRDANVVVSDNHPPAFVPAALSWAPFQPFVGVPLQLVYPSAPQPAHVEESQQKATVIQNKA